MWLHVNYGANAHPRSVSQMTGLVMATALAPFSLLSAMKGDTKRRLSLGNFELSSKQL